MCHLTVSHDFFVLRTFSSVSNMTLNNYYALNFDSHVQSALVPCCRYAKIRLAYALYRSHYTQAVMNGRGVQTAAYTIEKGSHYTPRDTDLGPILWVK